MIVQCENCSKNFNKKSNDIKRTTNNFCSRSCAGIYNNQKYPKRQKRKWFCKTCSLEVTYRKKYCDICRKELFSKCSTYMHRANKKPIEYFLTKNKSCSTSSLRNRLLDEQHFARQCCNCDLTEWLGHPIPLELHHIDGDKLNNSLSNLTILCPNCHAQTKNYRGKNKNRLGRI